MFDLFVLLLYSIYSYLLFWSVLLYRIDFFLHLIFANHIRSKKIPNISCLWFGISIPTKCFFAGQVQLFSDSDSAYSLDQFGICVSIKSPSPGQVQLPHRLLRRGPKGRRRAPAGVPLSGWRTKSRRPRKWAAGTGTTPNQGSRVLNLLYQIWQILFSILRLHDIIS